jgi:hypothetical protein
MSLIEIFKRASHIGARRASMCVFSRGTSALARSIRRKFRQQSKFTRATIHARDVRAKRCAAPQSDHFSIRPA